MAPRARSRSSGTPWRVVSGAGIALVGFSVGLLAGSLLEGPRLLLEWLRGPVRSLELPATEPVALETGSLHEMSDLHRPAVRRSGAPRPQRAAAPGPVAAARAPEPAPATPPREVVAELRREVDSRPAAPAAAPAPGPAPVVQVASTPDSAEAQRIVARLRASGFDAFSVAVRPNGIATHRVRVRAARDQTPAALAERLRAQGFDTWITRD